MTLGEIHRRFAAREITPAEAAALTMKLRAFRPMRGFAQRILVGVVGTVAIALLACPAPPVPGPNGPGGSGGSAPPPAPVTCLAACQHAVAVCPGVDVYTCQNMLCGPRGLPCTMALIAATDCPGVKAACR